MKHSQRKYQKTLEALVYVARKDTRPYWVLKTIYFADKEHLRRYGSQLFDDNYIAMKYGPVPSFAYDVVKTARGDGWIRYSDPDPSTALNVPNSRIIEARRDPDMRFLSQADIECLDYGWKEVKDLDFEALHQKSEDAAYKAVEQDEDMSIEAIIKTLENSGEVLEYRKAK